MYLLSKPPNWRVYESDIVAHCTDGRHAVNSGLHELLAMGYMQRRRLRDSLGKFRGFEYDVSEVPEFAPHVSISRFSDNGKSYTSNKEYSKPDYVWDEQAFQRGEKPNYDDPDVISK